VEVENVAAPVLSSVALPRFTAPSRNWTVPVGMPLLVLTDAVRTTALPCGAGLSEEDTVVVDVAITIVCCRAVETLLLLFASPE
jgi:hypothetical protein